MGRKPRNHRQRWTKRDINQIGVLARKGVDTDHIAKKLGRTSYAVQTKASVENISLMPKDKKNVK
ncbi:hypothetical protein GX888_03060 [Candidatus Dojkabacteria bacterium]|uniref:Uncharacterized protein n=1 Tax=Candidatus Dojkabacteria bacterium TaxID=2099670 RepID=A0A847VDW4_9BACT|nr:hypothetical protein [Candidatus Dojkabacteria bacterium]